MMHRLRRYDVFCFAQNDVAPVGRNDAMFAQCAARHTSFAKRTSLAEPTSFAVGKHHSKNAPLSKDKSAFFVAKKRANGAKRQVKTLKRCVNYFTSLNTNCVFTGILKYSLSPLSIKISVFLSVISNWNVVLCEVAMIVPSTTA